MSIYQEFNKETEEVINPLFSHDDKSLYHNAIRAQKYRFRDALFKKHNVSGKKAEKCWMIAWDDGHSCGFSEVELRFDTIVELIK